MAPNDGVSVVDYIAAHTLEALHRELAVRVVQRDGLVALSIDPVLSDRTHAVALQCNGLVLIPHGGVSAATSTASTAKSATTTALTTPASFVVCIAKAYDVMADWQKARDSTLVIQHKIDGGQLVMLFCVDGQWRVASKESPTADEEFVVQVDDAHQRYYYRYTFR